MLKTYKNKVVFILIQSLFILFLLCLLIIRGTQFEDIYILNIFAIIICIWTIFSYKILYGSIISIFTLFFLFSYLFTFGQVLVFCFELTDNIYINQIFTLFSKISIIKSVYFVTFSLLFLHLGCLISYKQKSCINKTPSYISLSNIRKLGILLFLITIIPTAIYDITLMITNLKYGYLAIFESSINSGIFDDLARTFKAALIFLLVGNLNNNRKFNILFILCISYSLAKMFLIGQRGYELAFIASLFLLKSNYNGIKMKKKDILKYFILAYLFMKITFVISEVRGMSTQYLTLEIIIDNFFDNSFFVNQLSELGASLGTICGFFEHVPIDIQFGYGMSYIKSFLTILPNLSIIGLQDLYIGYNPTILLSQYYNALGGSVYGELYYNFGYLGCILPTFLGIYLTKISDISNNALKVSFKIILTSMLLWMIRDSFSYLPRFVLFAMVFPFIIYKLMLMKKKKIRSEYND